LALMIAQDFQRKGLREAIAALAAVQCEEGLRPRLLVVGKQDARAYRRLAQSLNVADRVIFAGPTEDSAGFYQGADFFVLPTHHDPCSLVVLEALAMGLPVISTRRNGACEVMADGRHGFVLPDPADIPALAGAMRRMLDPQLRQSMAQACLELRSRLCSDFHVEQLLGLYQRVLCQRGAVRQK
jgi:UDP-glucose:(heptosyl)LPS alpha-1,3-glucosyltransferase